MVSPRILVIGATGTVGSEVVQQLTAAGARVRAMTRDPQSAGFRDDVEVVGGDLTDPATLERCVEGADAVFLVWTAPPAAAPQAIERIAKNTKRIVYLSAPHRTPHPFFQQPNPMAAMHADIERLIESSGLRWTFVRPGMFAANALMWWAPQIRAGDIVRWPYADAATAPVDERDVAAVIVRTLLDDARAGADYVLTGPESLTHREQVGILGNALHRSLRFEEMSPDEARREFTAPPAVVDMLLNAWAAAVGLPAYISSTVADITGRPPRTFRRWAMDHATEFATTETFRAKRSPTC